MRPVWGGMVSLLLLLNGCGHQGVGDLHAFVAESKGQKKVRIEPLPAIKTFETYAYQSDGLRDPFAPPVEPEPMDAGPAKKGGGLHPDANRAREELERFALDSLRMVGTLEQNGSIWGIVKAPGSIVFRVQRDNYMGKNHGRIARISEEKIELIEIVPDGTAAWRERPAALALIE